MKLATFLSGGDQHVAAWRLPERDYIGSSIDLYQRSIEVAEAAGLHLVLVGDVFPDSTDTVETLSHMPNYDRLEPLTMLSALARCTRHIGLVATATTTYNEPFNVARSFASLDQISGGRAGWNLVTTSTPSFALNFGRSEHVEHSDRYQRAEEFADVVTGLWNSWDADAFIRNKSSGRYFRPEGLRLLDHHGANFSVRGPLDVAKSPQGRPLIVQAGSSDQGKNLAVRVADVVFTAQQTIAGGKAFCDDLKARCVAAKRDPRTLLVLVGLMPIAAPTKEMARSKFEFLQNLIPLEVSLAKLSHSLGGVDLSVYDPDSPLPMELPQG